MAKGVKVSHLEMSDSRCRECRRPIKKNVVHRQPEADRCFVCHKISKGFKFLNRKGLKINLLERQAKQKVTYNKV